LQGETGATGPQGPQGIQGEPGLAPDLSAYATKAYVDGVIAALGDLSEDEF
jgi:hypothetical protein